MEALHAVLKARFQDRPAGHWVVFHGVISGVKVMAIAYAWSQRGVSYKISTCGSTETHHIKYRSTFEDDFGNIDYREINRPKVSHFLYDYLPLIDEHNKQRQNLLNLERCWCTKDCWFPLLTTLLGMCVVDMHRWHRNKRHVDLDGTPTNRGENDSDNDLQIRKFSDLLCGPLEKNARKQKAQRANPNPLAARRKENESDMLLSRIHKNDTCTREPTARQVSKGRKTGTAMAANCFICRKYLDVEGRTVYKQTSFCCASCRMPLCKNSTVDCDGRSRSCLKAKQVNHNQRRRNRNM
jgi:hypothetical protein